MRSISAALTAAQRAPSRDAFVSAVVRNDVECVRRLDFTTLNTTANSVGKHDVAVTDDGAVHRCRMQSGTVKYQRVTSPLVPANWDAWQDMATGQGSQIAISARGQRVLLVYSSSLGTAVRYQESTDGGLTFSADALLYNPGSTIIDLAVAYKDSGGDFACFAALASSIKAVRRTSGVLSGTLTDSNTYSAVSAIAATYAFSYDLLITGTEATTLKPTVWSGKFLHASDTWETANPQVQGDSGLTTFAAPFLTYLDTWRCNFTELPLYSGGITRTYRTYLHPQETWNRTAFLLRAPLPADHNVSAGLAVAHGGSPDFYYESSYERVQRAPTDLVTLDVSGDIEQLEIYESTLDAHGFIDLINPDDPMARRYAIPPSAPIKLGNMVRLGFGYQIPGGSAETSQIQDVWITAIEHRRSMRRGHAVLRLHVEGALRRLHRCLQRASITHTADDYRQILSAIMSRAGVSLSVTNASSRSDAVTPKFVIDPDTTAHAAMVRALAFLSDRIIAGAGSTAQLKELVSGAAAVYSLANETPDDPSEHPMTRLRLRVAPPPASEVWVASMTGALAYLSGVAVDHEAAQHGLAGIARIRDLTSTSIAAADETADKHMLQRRFERDDGDLACPPILGLELLDVLELDDPYASQSTTTKRVSAITWRFDRRGPAAIYEQTIALCPASDQDAGGGGIE
jgi:hypothetical protein